MPRYAKFYVCIIAGGCSLPALVSQDRQRVG